MANNLINDGGFDTAQPDGPVHLSAPFDGVNVDYVLDQDFVQFPASFVSLPLNTPHPLYGAYLLAKESPYAPAGAGVVKWCRTYAMTPASRSEYSSTVYRFIGYSGYVIANNTTATVPGRRPFSRAVNCRIQYDYFLVGAGLTYTNPNQIPVIPAQTYYFRIGTIVIGVSWTALYTLGSADDISQGSPVDYITDLSGPYALPGSLIPCVPSRTAYMALISAGSEIVSQASQISRWMGNIWVRQTQYVIAQ